MRRGSVLTSLYLVSLAAILFVSAGRIDWPMGWACLGVYIVISVTDLILVDRGLVKKLDVVLASLSFLFFFPVTLLVAGLDAGRYGWSPSPGIAVQLTTLAVFALGNAIGCWAMVRNKFFSTFVRIQIDRSHKVVTDGHYMYVRHPGYAGMILGSVALPLALRSLWALIPAFVGACGLVIRTAFEDGVLLQELSGYREYASRVRYRLISCLNSRPACVTVDNTPELRSTVTAPGRRVGTLCLHCLWFDPDPNFRPQDEQPPYTIPPL